jgi:glycosyltransferase involved in cell wall biosynthesis
MNLKISIITVVYNSANFLENTIKSVLNQNYKNIEYIIIDGGSEDGTIDIIKKYENRINYWVSEQDYGIYDAMNKGIAVSTGEYLYFLNAGDTLYRNDTIQSIVKNITNEKIDILTGNINVNNQNKEQIIKFSKFNRFYLMRHTINHQAIIAHRRCFRNSNNFKIEYNIRADYEWLVRCIIGNELKIRYYDIIIANYLFGGYSKKNEREGNKEKRPIIKQYFPIFYSFLYELYLIYLQIYKTIRK